VENVLSEQKAVIVVDMQKDNVGKYCQSIIPKIKILMQKAREKGIPIIFACDSRYPDDFLFSRSGRPPRAIRGTDGARVIDELEPICGRIGAVNTIKIQLDGTWKGYNTDYIGFVKPIHDYLDKMDTCLFIGAGGAAQAVGFGLLEFSPIKKFVIIDPIQENAEKLIQKLRSFSRREYEIYDSKLINDLTGSFDLIINMSPVGMGSMMDQSPLSIKNISHSQTFVYDLIYNPAQTLLLKEAEEFGLKTINGLPMLIGQAEESFKIWTGKIFSNEIQEELETHFRQ